MYSFADYPVGRVERFGAYKVTREEVIDFARQYDPQRFHLDDEAAAANPIFGRIPASGWHTCGMVMRMMTDQWTDETGYFSLGGSGVDELRWLKPVYPGDTLSVETEVLSTSEPRSKPDLGFVTLRVTVFNQDQDPVMSMTVTNIQRKLPAQD